MAWGRRLEPVVAAAYTEATGRRLRRVTRLLSNRERPWQLASIDREVAELVQLLVERVQANGPAVAPESIEWTPPARPFFEESALLWRPRTDSNRRRAP